jgi:hypothetical protein
MQTIELLLGGIIVVSTGVDIFQSVVVPRPTRGSLRLAPFLLDGMWPLWKWIALRFPSAKYRAACLGIYAPLTVVILLLVWGIALIFGYGLLFLAFQSELQPRLHDLGTALYFAGTSLLTIGFGDIVATGGITRVLALFAGASYTRLQSAGYCLADPEPACASFIVLRSAYADALHSLMKYWVVSQRKF